MNPNLEYGQIIRGNGKSATGIGRAEGLISARALVNPIRAVKMLQTSHTSHWSKSDSAGMVDWWANEVAEFVVVKAIMLIFDMTGLNSSMTGWL